jgi:hypothetical protein
MKVKKERREDTGDLMLGDFGNGLRLKLVMIIRPVCRWGVVLKFLVF